MNFAGIARAFLRFSGRLPATTGLLVCLTLFPVARVNAAPPECVMAVRVRDVGALTTAVEHCRLAQAVMHDPLAAQAVQWLQAGRGLLFRYLTSMSPEQADRLFPKEWTYFLFPLSPDQGDQAQPDWVQIGLAGKGEELGRIWAERVIPRIEGLTRKSTMLWRRARLNGVPAWVHEAPGRAPQWLIFTPWGMLLGSRGGVQAALGAPSVPAWVASVDQRLQAAGFQVSGGIAVWVNVENSIRRTLEGLAGDSEEVREMQILGTDALARIAAAAVPKAGDFSETIGFFPAAGRAFGGLLGAVHGMPPRHFVGPGLCPSRTLAFLGLSVGSGDHLLGAIRALVKQWAGPEGVQNVDVGFQMLGAQLGLDFGKDVFGLLGGELFVAVLPGKKPFRIKDSLQQTLSGVSWLGGVAVKNEAAAAGLVRKLLMAPILMPFGLNKSREVYGGQVMTTVTLSQVPGRNGSAPIHFSFMFRDNMLLISDAATTLESVVDAAAGRKTLARTAAWRARVPKNGGSVALFYADAGRLAAATVPGWVAAGGPQLVPLAPIAAAAAKALGGIRLDLLPRGRSLLVECRTALPVLTVFTAGGAFGHFSRPKVERRVKLAEKRMKSLGQALRKYYRTHGDTPPASLYELRPEVLRNLPEDPFRPGETFGYGITLGGGGWVLISAGPDGRRDIDPTQFEMNWWNRIRHAATPADIETAKRLIYQFRPKKYPDERAPGDEGDIVRTGTW